jgi:hypothetical protein
VPISSDWVSHYAGVWGRAVELAYQRRKAAVVDEPFSPLADLDNLVELNFWLVAMRQLWRVAEAARALNIPQATVAAEAFESQVNVRDLIEFRNVLQHGDDYAVGRGHKPPRPIRVDMIGWTQAALTLAKELREAVVHGKSVPTSR